MKCTFVIPLLVSLVGCASTPPAPSGEARLPSHLPVGHVEAPHPDEAVRGPWPISGWAVSEIGIVRVDIFLDRDYLGSAQLGGSRPDVQKAFPPFKDSSTAGWSFTLQADSIPPGRHELIVQARSSDGTTRDIGVIPLNVVH